jgi:hypothetical protein
MVTPHFTGLSLLISFEGACVATRWRITHWAWKIKTYFLLRVICEVFYLYGEMVRNKYLVY